jgi:hypothetical protein
MFLLYHSKGCNIYGMEFHKCYINDLRTTTCSGMLGHRKYQLARFAWQVALRACYGRKPMYFGITATSMIASSYVQGWLAERQLIWLR